MKNTSAFIIFLMLSAAALAKDPEPYLKSAQMPFYPPLARQARIEGTVSLRFVVNEQGDTSDIETTAGNELLRRAAMENVQTWRFAWPHPCACRAKREVVFVYSLAGDWVDEDGPGVMVKWFWKGPVARIEIQTGGTLVQP